MVIEEMGTEITQVPGIDFIRVERDAASERNVHVLIKWADQDEPVSYGIKEISELAIAIELASNHAIHLAEFNGYGR